MNKNRNGGSVLAGLILGAAAGIAAGLLLAPEKGSVTRKKLKKKAEEFTDNLETYAKDMGDKAQKFAEEVEKQIKDKVKDKGTSGEIDA